MGDTASVSGCAIDGRSRPLELVDTSETLARDTDSARSKPVILARDDEVRALLHASHTRAPTPTIQSAMLALTWASHCEKPATTFPKPYLRAPRPIGIWGLR